MEKHYGQILEMVIRKQGVSISELARLADINRKCIYNWFNQKYLKSGIIYKVGILINHDFSIEYPELFTKEDFNKNNNAVVISANHPETPEGLNGNTANWKDKYIDLLEKYNNQLINQLKD
jgi:lambda repressor-like predicted transcriptional regulator